MRSKIACGLIVGGLLAGAAFAAEQGPVEPGGKIGAMTVARGDQYHADVDLFPFCPRLMFNKPGTYHRSCSPEIVRRLFIGAGDIAPTQKEVDSKFKSEHWSLWVDGHPVDLPRFGASHGYDYRNGKRVVSKTWNVMLVNAPSGKHTIRYRFKLPQGIVNLMLALTIP
jgi:hypothetical protein